MTFEIPDTHHDFRSIDPNVRDVAMMDGYLSEALFYQHMFDKRTTPWEAQEWDYGVLQEFEVKLEMVDRLYYIHYNSDGVSGRDFKLIARVEYEGKALYVEMIASCDYTGFECQGGGFIFVSRDANLFMKLVLTEREDDLNKKLIYESLQKDSIYVEEEDEILCEKFSRMMRECVPMLKYLCHEVVYQNRNTLRGYKTLLPKILIQSIDDFIRDKEARIAYNDY